MQRPGIAVLLLAAVATLALPATGSANHRSERKALTPQGEQLAKSLVVRRADLTGQGWTSSARSQLSDHEDRCPGAWDPDYSDLTVTGVAKSRTYKSTVAVAVSGSTIYKSVAQARRAWRRALIPSFLPCAARQLTERRPPGATATVLSARRIAARGFGDDVARYRIVTRIQSGTAVNLYFDIVLIRRGRGIVVLRIGRLRAPYPVLGVAAKIDRRMASAGL